MRIVSGHQPSYLPWLGFFHKAMLCDVYVYMDDVQYLVGDWNNRNKVKASNGQGTWLTVPVDLKASASQSLKDIVIKDESHMPEKNRWYAKHFATLQAAYGKAPYFKDHKDFFASLYMEQKWHRLSDLNFAVLKEAFRIFGIDCEVKIASQCEFKNRKSDLILEHAHAFDANMVVTGTFGKDYIEHDKFREQGIQIYHQEYVHPTYPQRFGDFVPFLSYVDLLFNVGAAEAREVILKDNLKKEDLCKTLN